MPTDIPPRCQLDRAQTRTLRPVSERPDLPLTGGCMCGAVRFELTEAPLSAGYCHCTRCQRRTGTDRSIALNAAPGSFRVTEGEGHVRVYSPLTGFEKAFCADCGSALFSRDPSDHEVISVRMGATDSDPGIRPSYHQFVADAAPWETIPADGLPRYPERRPGQPGSD